MSIGFDIPLSLRLGGVVAQTVVAPPPPPPPLWTPVLLRHTLPYGQQILLKLEVAWSYTQLQQARLVAPYGDTIGLARSVRCVWATNPELRTRHLLPYGEPSAVAKSIQLPWGACRAIVVRHASRYASMGVITRSVQVGWGASSIVATRHTSGYGETNSVAQVLRCSWATSLVVAARLTSHYGETNGVVQVNRSAWNFSSAIGVRQIGRYSETIPVAQTLQCTWQASTSVAIAHASYYGETDPITARLLSEYWLTTSVATSLETRYHLLERNPVQRTCRLPWALVEDLSIQSVWNTPELVWNGRTIRILKATLSCDEDSPVWIARIEIAAVENFALMQIGDALSLTVGLESFAFIIDGKTFSRASIVDRQCEITAVSPLALYDAPFTGAIQIHETAAISARAAVESLIGGVDWHLPEWTIPADRLRVDGATPLAAARNIVAAIGGVVESYPDGSVLCRRRHPVSVPQYGLANLSHSLLDADVIESRAQVSPQRGYNRITIANEESAGRTNDDRIESITDPDNPWQRTVRAYLATPRTALLTHTGNPGTIIGTLGKVTRTEIETVEFVAGQASVRYPITRIVSATWRHADLGAITVDQNNLSSSVPGYSLLVITYTTTSLDWHVHLDADEDVQFVLVDV
ncbi:MAG: hypothetical protein HY847_04625 [Betaproteobacteria bacterium]|nr:hypothetical protein [Betaproteobacteria bacterium]